ncbi:MAG TPA: hypothetical protein VOB72_18295 [Candidatus Dormibacteraeota bacterium]|nr:hypothetical protein [Candidatus Dormibacteraeota bacterium]
MIDGEGLPGFPPLPDAAATVPESASLLRVVQALHTGALEVADGDLHALVLFDQREVVDGYLEHRQQAVVGPEVLDHLDGAPIAKVRLHWLSPGVLRALPCWWRTPTQVTIGPNRWMDGEMLVRSFVRPRQRGVVCVRVTAGLGLVLIEDGVVQGAYRGGGDRVGDVAEIVPLFDDPSAVLIGRVEAIGADREPPERNRLLDDIEQAVRSEIHDYAEPAVAVFRSAPPTREGLLEAAEQVERMRIRMISPDRMQAVAERARQIIASAG